MLVRRTSGHKTVEYKGDTKMNDELKVKSVFLNSKHVCESLLRISPNIISIDENNKLVVVSYSRLNGSTIIWTPINFCPFCGEKLK